MAGYDGYSKSNNALIAEANGLLPLTHAIKAVQAETGCTAKAAREALIAEGPCEWHHTSSKYNKTNYYEWVEAVRSIRLADVSKSWPADWSERLTRLWPSLDVPVDQRKADVEALLRSVAAEIGTDCETLRDAYYAL